MAIFIGIDPGTKTGLAVWNTTGEKFTKIVTTSIVDAMQIVRRYASLVDTRLVMEDARQRKWLPRERSNSEYRGKLMGAGSIKRDCEIWQEFADFYQIPLTLVPPRKGLTKWDAQTFARLTGWTGRTSNHARDAALLVWGRTM